jgi:hypothetical protein
MTVISMRKSYSEMCRRETFDERFEYLRLGGSVGRATFGFDRYINQEFYTSYEWRRVRQQVILRDWGCDLGVLGHEVHGQVLVHHINPMIPEDVVQHADWILDPEFLVTVSHTTHNAIHYGDRSLLPKRHVERQSGDTRLW